MLSTSTFPICHIPHANCQPLQQSRQFQHFLHNLDVSRHICDFFETKNLAFLPKKKIAIFAATNKFASTLHSLSLLTLSLTLLRQLVLLLCLFALLLLLLLLLLPLLISIALSASWHMMRRRKFCTNCLHQRFCILIA